MDKPRPDTKPQPRKTTCPGCGVMASRGRPEIELDAKQAEAFGACRATQETMAAIYGCHVDTIKRRMQDEDSEFCRAYKRGFSRTKMRISEAQINYALMGNASLLIWLGKQHLGQTDNPAPEDESDFELIDKWADP
jgi:hypothetical protein